MIHNVLKVGDWVVDVLIAEEDYDMEGVLSCMYEIDASYHWMMRAYEIMKSGEMNKAFTYSNADRKRALIVIGPASSGKEFQDSIVHEIHHLAVHILSAEGFDLEGEEPAYVAGDSIRELAEVVCEMGCPRCNPE
ncbi:MAG: hypothetical protein IJ819_05255 [Clostridiales bacterium]|nr:hypothetical protein [Clostridiales bacterium]